MIFEKTQTIEPDNQLASTTTAAPMVPVEALALAVVKALDEVKVLDAVKVLDTAPMVRKKDFFYYQTEAFSENCPSK